MKKTTYAVIFLCICMLLSGCMGKGREGGTAEIQRSGESMEAGKETSGDEKTKSREEKAEPEEVSNKGKEEKESEMEWVEVKAPVYMPETLFEFLENLAGKENEEIIENITPLINDIRLEEEELEFYKDDPAVAECMDRIEESGGISGGGMLLRTDGDNDGIEDLFAWISDGGSMGNNSRVFLKGQEDGSFVRTDAWEDITQELIFIEFEGKNYLLETTYNYYKKYTDGFLVSCFQDGVCCERAYILLTSDGYETDIQLSDSDYEELARKIAGMADEGFEKEYSYDWLLDIGDGEGKDDAPEGLEDTYRGAYYHSDINNDGEEEWYTKYIFYPSSLSAYMYLEDSLYLQGNSEGEELLAYYDLEYEGVPLAFWVEHVEETDKQIVCLLCYEGLSRYVVYGILIEGETTSEVMEIDFRGNEKVEYIVEILQEIRKEETIYYRFLDGQIEAANSGGISTGEILSSYYEYGPLNYAYVDLNDDGVQELLIYPDGIFMQILTIDHDEVYWVDAPFYSGATGEIINANKEIVMVDESHAGRRQYSVYRLNDEKELEDIIFFQVWFGGEISGYEGDVYTQYIGGLEKGTEESITEEEFDALYEKYVQDTFEVEWMEFAPN